MITLAPALPAPKVQRYEAREEEHVLAVVGRHPMPRIDAPWVRGSKYSLVSASCEQSNFIFLGAPPLQVYKLVRYVRSVRI